MKLLIDLKNKIKYRKQFKLVKETEDIIKQMSNKELAASVSVDLSEFREYIVKNDVSEKHVAYVMYMFNMQLFKAALNNRTSTENKPNLTVIDNEDS